MAHHGPALAPAIDLNCFLEAGLRRDPAATALQDPTYTISWAELDRQAEQLARACRRLAADGLHDG
jgi:acyl-CoA synthetase (AMP-forming)/AMP-acid ligase II